MSNTSSLFGNMKGERREKKEKGFGNETMGARAEQRGGSTRQEDMREGGKVESVEGKTDMITKETARTPPPHPLGRKRRKSVAQTKRKKSTGRRKKGSGRTARGRRRRRV